MNPSSSRLVSLKLTVISIPATSPGVLWIQDAQLLRGTPRILDPEYDACHSVLSDRASSVDLIGQIHSFTVSKTRRVQ